MPDKIEALIKEVYRNWKRSRLKPQDMHINEETLACFCEGLLSEAENERVKEHLICCESCSQAIALSLDTEKEESKVVPEELLSRLKETLGTGAKRILEIFLRIKDTMLEVINANGDILVGQELVPAPVLRSRNIKGFKNEVTILKDFSDIRLEVKIENKEGKNFNLFIQVKQIHTSGLLKGLRITLIRGDLELESYFSETGSVNFEHVLPGKYSLEISNLSGKLAWVILDVHS